MKNNFSQKYYLLLAPIMAVLLLAMIGVTVQAEDATWRARFWNNRDMKGDPDLVREDKTIDFDWGGGSPAKGINDDDFSARWTRRVNFQPGTYRFSATMDDGMRVYLDGNIIIDSWTDSQEHTMVQDVFVSGGEHDLRVDYYEAGNVAIAKFSWQLLGSGGDPGAHFPNWKAEYFNNTSLAGTPVLVRDDRYLNNNWGYGSPAPGIVGQDFFSVRWTKTLDGVPGPYHIFLTSDDGSRLYIDDLLVIDNWGVQAPTTKAADYYYPGGPVNIRVEYFENTERASIDVHLARIQP